MTHYKTKKALFNHNQKRAEITHTALPRYSSILRFMVEFRTLWEGFPYPSVYFIGFVDEHWKSLGFRSE